MAVVNISGLPLNDFGVHGGDIVAPAHHWTVVSPRTNLVLPRMRYGHSVAVGVHGNQLMVVAGFPNLDFESVSVFVSAIPLHISCCT